MILLASLALAQPAAPPPAPPPPVNRDCHDDNMVDRCAEAQQRRVRQLYGVRSIEEHRAAGDQVRRVFYVDGYGRDLVAIAFVRAPGHDPTLWVHYPRREGEPRPAPAQAPVPQAAWDEVRARSAHFDRSFAPRPAENSDGLLRVCLHSWVYTIEATDPALDVQPPNLRRKTEDACEGGPGGAYARELDRIALSLLPHCAALDREQHRNAATMLDSCRLLRGDRLAAAEALNLAGAFRRMSTREEAGIIFGRFRYRAVVDWNGSRNQGAGSAMAFWLDRLFAENRPSLFLRSAEGISANEARVTGYFHRAANEDEGREQRAAVELVWIRDQGGDLRVERATVGPWEPDRRR